MRVEALLLCIAMAVTGCAGLTPASNQGRSLSYTPREANGPASAPPGDASSQVSAAPPRFVTGSEKPVRLHRRKGAREVATGANPVRTTGVPRGSPQADVWEKLLTAAGLEERDARPIPGGALTPTQATRLLSVFLGKPVTLGTFPARMAVGHVLREVLEQGEVSRDTLLRRVERFRRVAVLRPDGHLAWVWTGRTQQKAGALKWKDGTFRAGPFELGRFYVSNGFVIELADEQLEPVHGPVFVEVYDDADLISRTLDGAEAAVVKLALALGQFLTAPRDSIAALKDLPAGVVALLASSPEYFERFRYMTRGEQVQAVAELTTSLLVTKGTATSATRTVTGALAGAEATVPVLSLSAQGALTLERIAVPVGRAASVLGGGPGAAIVLQRANTATGQSSPAGGRGPGQWAPSEERGAPPRARAYQEQISGCSSDDAYWVGGVGRKSGGVKFDGFTDGVLLEAKGPGYAEFFEGNLAPKNWFKSSGKAQDIVDQGRRQRDIARGTGSRIEWHVAEKHAADAIRKLLKGNDITEIAVIHTPARPLVP
ncbi:hypothetical protein D7Y13_26555 [Corallococcus praedator]|uniref:Tox-REase-5 domain-containing protein n=1 Tax=Corallococcus praedator TaxID=2316724 RepID=A0ABX9QBS9_9BACT|nr:MULTISPECIES: Tox-REase-5 domain-containing protein [Corallococcus]RKH24077.1 hypothetical protein D7X75_32560 [Corallococcus sp. CA031C]RKI00711.1 hypothetical protein D7Y13_26555 [Corallococcus praedator]